MAFFGDFLDGHLVDNTQKSPKAEGEGEKVFWGLVCTDMYDIRPQILILERIMTGKKLVVVVILCAQAIYLMA